MMKRALLAAAISIVPLSGQATTLDVVQYADPAATIIAVEAPLAPEGAVIRLSVYKNAMTFLRAAEGKFESHVGADGVAVFALADIEPGTYSFAAYYDKNGDGRLNRNAFGRPTEPYVFSNNVHPRLSKPSFNETAVRADRGRVIVLDLKN